MLLEKAYKILEVNKDSSVEEIEEKYIELIKKYHPDLYENHPLQELAKEKTQEINEAYALLKEYITAGKNKFGKQEENEYYENIQIESYDKYYSSSSFWEKMGNNVKKVGIKGVTYALALYYILQNDKVPLADKSLIIGALGYFILPIDIIPDITFGIGYTDDAAVMYFVIKKCSKYINRELISQVYIKLKEWFDVEYREIEETLKVFV